MTMFARFVLLVPNRVRRIRCFIFGHESSKPITGEKLRNGEVDRRVRTAIITSVTFRYCTRCWDIVEGRVIS